MSERKRRTEENIEDVERVSDNLNRRARKEKRKNPFLKPDGGFNLVEKLPGIDFLIYRNFIYFISQFIQKRGVCNMWESLKEVWPKTFLKYKK